MKHAIIILMLVLLCTAALAAEPEKIEIKISLINQEPNPVEPGDSLTLRFRVENIGTSAAQDVSVALKPGFPFTLVPGEVQTKRVGTISSRQTGSLGATTEHRLTVDPSANEGRTEIYVYYKIADQTETRLGPYNITLQGRQPAITISSVESFPNEAAPGQKMNVTITLANSGRGTIKDIQVGLDLENDDTPFAPIGSAQNRAIGDLQSGQERKLFYSLVSLPSATAGVYKIPVTITYTEPLGKNFTKDDLIALTIGGKPNIMAYISEQSTIKPGNPGDITIQIVNSGLIDVKLTTLEMQQGTGYEIISPSTLYMGKLDSDDFDTAKYSIYVNKDAKELKIPIKLTYKDANNNEYTETRELTPKLYTDGQAQQYGLEKGSMLGIALITAIILAGLFIYFKIIKKKQ